MIRVRLRKNGFASMYFAENRDRMDKIALNLTGIPTTTTPTPAVPFLVSMGYSVFQPQYIGSFDSAGEFAPENTIRSVFEAAEQIGEGVVFDLRDEVTIKIASKADLLVAHSFGTYSGIGAIIRGFRPKLAIMFSPMFEFGSKKERVGLKLDLERHARYISAALPLTFRTKDPNILHEFFVEQSHFHPDPDLISSKEEKLTRVLAIVGSEDPSIDPQINEYYVRTFIEEYSDAMHLDDYLVAQGAGHSVEQLLASPIRDQIEHFITGH